MTKFKRWLIDRYLPAYCRDELLEENERLREQCGQLACQCEQLQAYAYGLEMGLRSQRKAITNSGVGK